MLAEHLDVPVVPVCRIPVQVSPSILPPQGLSDVVQLHTLYSLIRGCGLQAETALHDESHSQHSPKGLNNPPLTAKACKGVCSSDHCLQALSLAPIIA